MKNHRTSRRIYRSFFRKRRHHGPAEFMLLPVPVRRMVAAMKDWKLVTGAEA